MKQTFDSLDEAQKAADKKNDSEITQFCPLINAVCNSGFPYGAQYGCCVCWEEAKAVGSKFKNENGNVVYTEPVGKNPKIVGWYVTTPFCGNAMFTETEIYLKYNGNKL